MKMSSQGNKVYLIGHRNPDTDSICSPIAYAYLRSRLEPDIEFVPVRLGPINRETQFVLDYFRVPVPALIENVYAQVSDLAFDKSVNVNGDTSMREAWRLMTVHGVKTISVTGTRGELAGVATLGDIAEAHLETGPNLDLRDVPLDNLLGTLGGVARVRHGNTVSGRVTVEGPCPAGTGVYISCDPAALSRAIHSGVWVVVATSGARVSHEDLAAAVEKGVTVIEVGISTYEAAHLISQSRPVREIMTQDNLVAFDLDDYLDDVRETMLHFKYRNFPVMDGNGIPVGMLARRHILDYSGKNVILVDHNEKSQSAEGIAQARVLEIIDHHRISSVETDQPIVFINRPVGSTATIVYGLFEQKGIVPPKEIAGIMCAAMLSDTLAMKSPTTTEEDKRAVSALSEIAGLDVNEFTAFMFEAGTSLEGKTELDILMSDLKEFHVAGFKIGVSQVNIYKQNLGRLKDRLVDAMERVKDERGFDLYLMMLTDIINEGSEVLFVGNRSELVERAFDVDARGKSVVLPGVISRKKQVIPRIIRAINSL